MNIKSEVLFEATEESNFVSAVVISMAARRMKVTFQLLILKLILQSMLTYLQHHQSVLIRCPNPHDGPPLTNQRRMFQATVLVQHQMQKSEHPLAVTVILMQELLRCYQMVCL